MNTEYAHSQGRTSTRWTREGAPHSRVSHHSAREILATSKRVALSIYGNRPSEQLRRRHLQNVLGGLATSPSPQPAAPSFERTHFYQTSRPRRNLRSGILACLSEGNLRREGGPGSHLQFGGDGLGGDDRQPSCDVQLDQRARVTEGRRIPLPASTATHTACLSPTSSAAHRHDPDPLTHSEPKNRSAARTLTITNPLLSLELGTEKRRGRVLPSALLPTPPRRTKTLDHQDTRPWGLQPD